MILWCPLHNYTTQHTLVSAAGPLVFGCKPLHSCPSLSSLRIRHSWVRAPRASQRAEGCLSPDTFSLTGFAQECQLWRTGAGGPGASSPHLVWSRLPWCLPRLSECQSLCW